MLRAFRYCHDFCADENASTIKHLVLTLHTLLSTVADMEDVVNELISENKKIRKEIEILKTGTSSGSVKCTTQAH